MEANINKLMKGHSWKMSEEEIHDELVKLGYITDNIDFSKIDLISFEISSLDYALLPSDRNVSNGLGVCDDTSKNNLDKETIISEAA
ncbi:hypothetical protein K9P40_05010 [Lentilactobacillus otakiensis]|uniref:hypothetical protein n=1 Tax=Lentilactobacillus otakiensis TaxID=481720 RepID=UPI001CBC2E89|nr:hypothetical protein [Lentilactobacillus otakiensis]MBZ3776434.1 hypothetical protein [Lentilactobacillus otakiensis]